MARLLATLRRIGPPAAVILYVEWALFMGLVFVDQSEVSVADSTADWLVASAARDGVDPYTDMRILSEMYRVPYLTPLWDDAGDAPWIHPRTPAALLMMQPLTRLSPEALLSCVIWASLVALAIIGVTQLSRLGSRPWWVGLLFGAALIVSAPIVRTAQFGAWSVFLALLIGAAWVTARKEDSWLAGLYLGVAIALRLFPGLLIVPLLMFRRWKAASASVVTAISLNVAGILLLRLPNSSVVGGLGNAGDIWVDLRGNASLVGLIHRFLPWPVMGIVLVVALATILHLRFLYVRGADFDLLMAVAVVSMLLASPLSWEHYDVMLFGVLACLLSFVTPRVGGITVYIWVLAMTVGFIVRQPLEQDLVLAAGLPSFLGRCLLLVVLTYVSIRVDTRSRAVDPTEMGPDDQTQGIVTIGGGTGDGTQS